MEKENRRDKKGRFISKSNSVLIPKDIINLYNKGISLPKIAEKYGCSFTPISKILKIWNVEMRPKGFQKGHEQLNSGRTHFKKGDERLFGNKFNKGKTPWNKDKKCPQLSMENNGMYGKNHKEESIKKIAESNKGKHYSPETEFKKGSIPWSKYNKGYSTSKKIKFNDIQKGEIIELYLSGKTSRQIANLFLVDKEVICNNLKSWGIILKSPNYRIPFNTDDGHKVRSYPEAIIDNFFFNNGIKHIYGKGISNTKYRYDFYLPEFNLYIEYWGINNDAYNERMGKKLELYKRLGLNLLSIFPKDNIQQKLNIILEAKKQNVKEIKVI